MWLSPDAWIMIVNGLVSMNSVTGEVMPPCVMVSRDWLGEEVGKSPFVDMQHVFCIRVATIP